MTTTRSSTTPAQRLLEAAGTLFAQEGIRAVGVDRVLAAAGVARASLYHAFGSKDALVAAYIADQDRADRGKWEEAAAELTTPLEKVLVLFDLARTAALRRDFRGCLYLNAATEFPDPEHPARHAVTQHRAWLREILVDQLAQAGATEPEPLVERIVVLYDGAVAGSKFSRSTEPIDLGREMAERLVAQGGDGSAISA